MPDPTHPRDPHPDRSDAAGSERSFRSLILLAPVGIFETDATGNCLFVNQRWCELAGMSAEEASGQGWLEALHPGDRERVFHEWYDAATADREFHSEYRFQAGDRVTWLHGTAAALRDPAGTAIGYIGTVTDIDERKAVEAALRQAEARLQAVLSSVEDHLVCYDREWRYTFVNEAAAKVLGRSQKELVGRSIWELFPDAVGNQFYQELHQAVAEQRVIRSEHYYAPFGTWFENHIYPSRDGVTVFSSDVTFRKRLEDELRRQNEQLEESDRLKDEFLAVLAHELRTPLAPLRNALEVMKMPEADAEAITKMRGIAERQLGHMARLLDDLLDVSRISRGSIDLRREPVDVIPLVLRTVEAMGPMIEEARHELVVSLPSQPLYVSGDATRLEQVLMNLLGNAAKYTPPGGRISIVGRRKGDDVVVRVQDSGVGMPQDMLPRIFNLFVQGERRLSGGQGGLGIGLTLVRKLVELHGGSVEASSDGLGKGSLFTVRLPALSGAPASSVGSDERPSRADVESGSRRILVVDDSRDAADSLALLLRLASHDVRVAYDGEQALALARDYEPDLVLLDIGMPGMDGYEVARELRGDPSTRRAMLIALTGWGQDKDRKRSADAGFDHHLTKPVAFGELERLLAGSVGRDAQPPRRGLE